MGKCYLRTSFGLEYTVIYFEIRYFDLILNSIITVIDIVSIELRLTSDSLE